MHFHNTELSKQLKIIIEMQNNQDHNNKIKSFEKIR